MTEHPAIELSIAEHLIGAELLIAEDVVTEHLVEESPVAERSVTVERNGWSKTAGIK